MSVSRGARQTARARRAAPYYSGLVRQRRSLRRGAGRPGAGRAPGGVARNTAIFSIATGFSRIAGLVREIVAASYFGTTGYASAFTIAFQVPNFVAQLFAHSALSAAFVPVFTDLLQKGRRKEALRLASTLFWIMLIALGRDHGVLHPRRRRDHAAVHRPDIQPAA